MARKPRIEPIHSRQFEIIIGGEICAQKYWFARNRKSCASTESSFDFGAYYSLKRVWRKSKEDFDSACRFMDFNDLFSITGVRLS